MGLNQNEIWEFSRALSIAEEKNAYALGKSFYNEKLGKLKELRNKIHLQSADNIGDADYAIFENIEVINEIKKILYSFLQKCLSIPTKEMDETFHFLLPIEDFIHSKDSENTKTEENPRENPWSEFIKH